EDDEEAACGREPVAAVVGAFERGRGEDLTADDPQEAHGHDPHQERDHHRHWPRSGSRSASANTTRASRITAVASAIAAIIPGMVIPESLSAKPSTATTPSDNALIRAVTTRVNNVRSDRGLTNHRYTANTASAMRQP